MDFTHPVALGKASTSITMLKVTTSLAQIEAQIRPILIAVIMWKWFVTMSLFAHTPLCKLMTIYCDKKYSVHFIISPLRQHTLQGVEFFAVGILITLLNKNLENGTKPSAGVSWRELKLNSICDNRGASHIDAAELGHVCTFHFSSEPI